METFKWFISSSKNPKNISLLIKGLATLLILVGADAVVVNQLNSDVMSLVTKAFELIALIASVWGGIRKLNFRAKLGRWGGVKRDNYEQ